MTRFSSCRIILVVLAATATASPSELTAVDPAKVGFDPSKLSQVEAAIQEHVDAGDLVGAMGLVMRDNKIVFSKTWGQRDREKQLPMTDDTIFRIYSMTKPITSVAAMTLVENGKLALDDPISKYLPALAERKVLVEMKGGGEATTKEIPATREITVRDLLRHTSGLTYGFFGDSEVDKMYKSALVLITDRTLEDTITKLATIPLKHQPGARWHYSVSTDVLGRIIEVASGARWTSTSRNRSLNRSICATRFSRCRKRNSFDSHKCTHQTATGALNRLIRCSPSALCHLRIAFSPVAVGCVQPRSTTSLSARCYSMAEHTVNIGS